MRYLVTPTFSEKATSAGPNVLEAARKAIEYIEGVTKENVMSRSEVVLDGTPLIYAIKDKDCRILLTFGSDNEGEYALLLDIIVHGRSDGLRPLRSNDPRINMMVDPNRNMMIDPTRNLIIDPRRNVVIDPQRNMMIDPRRNMMIDPNRNMMIDVRRNIMIDPARNFAIDPKRNWQINPRNNSAWDGPWLHNLKGDIVGFVIRANDEVALLFDTDGAFLNSMINAGKKNINLFDRNGNWEGFLVHNGSEGYNQFDLNNSWVGFLVGEPQLSKS